MISMALCLVLMHTSHAAELREFGQKTAAPGFELEDLSGNGHTLSDYRGKVVLVNFWASWCGPCVIEMPALKSLAQRMKDRPFEIVAINYGEKKFKVYRFTKLINFDLTVLLDTTEETFKDWGGITLPTSYLVDGNGNIRYGIRGDPGWESEETLAVIEGLLEEVDRSN